MEDLPAEILQQIAWFSLNPELYLVSKMINSKLPPLSQFELDVALLLFCPRIGYFAGWDDVDPFPWQTTPAIQSDYTLTIEQRTELQQTILNQSWFSAEKFLHIVITIHKTWVRRQWIWDRLTVKNRIELDGFLEQYPFRERTGFPDDDGKFLVFDERWIIAIYEPAAKTYCKMRVFEVLCYPLKLFVRPRSPGKLKLFYLLGPSIPDFELMDEPVRFSCEEELVMERTCKSVIDDEDIDWFKVFLALSRSQDVGFSELDMASDVLNKRKWDLMKVLYEEYLLSPDNRSIIYNRVSAAAQKGDTGACDFQQWVTKEPERCLLGA